MSKIITSKINDIFHDFIWFKEIKDRCNTCVLCKTCNYEYKNKFSYPLLRSQNEKNELKELCCEIIVHMTTKHANEMLKDLENEIDMIFMEQKDKQNNKKS